MEHDVFTDHRFSSVREGDTVAVLNCGAYTMSLANQFCYPRPAVVLVDSAVDKLVRKRELLEDVIEKEL
jgi:diaminopimelate decarboxylase